MVPLVGAGVGLAAIFGTLRFVYGWSLKPLIFFALTPAALLTVLDRAGLEKCSWFGLGMRPLQRAVTVPLVLAMGIGIANSAGKGDSTLSGFGIVTLASLFPVTAVLLLTLFVYFQISPAEIIANANLASASAGSVVSIWEQTPAVEIVLGVRAILPLVIFLFLVLYFILKIKLSNKLVTIYGLILCVVGMCIFNLGLTYGLGAVVQTGRHYQALLLNYQ